MRRILETEANRGFYHIPKEVANAKTEETTLLLLIRKLKMEASKEISILTMATMLRKKIMKLDQGSSSTQIMFQVWMIQMDQNNTTIENIEAFKSSRFKLILTNRKYCLSSVLCNFIDDYINEGFG